MAFVYNINVDNVNEALPRGLQLLSASGMRQASRNGDVAVMPVPVQTIINKPMERVLLCHVRDANPFFHLFESLWMLAGRQDLPWVTQFNQQMKSYSDDGGKTQPAAYGYRWRNYFGYDQLDAIVAELEKDPGSRRAVLAMWDGGADRDNSILVPITVGGDLGRVAAGTADAPCNTHCYFRVINGQLDMGVYCRSNDILWGAYGANIVHFSVLLEYLATRLQLRVGVLYQHAWNYHVYLDILGGGEKAAAMTAGIPNPYAKGLRTTEIVHPNIKDFDADLKHFMDIADPAIDDVALLEDEKLQHGSYRTPFFSGTATPMLWAWGAHKRKEYAEALNHCSKISGQDWRMAATAWITRREAKHMEKQNG